MLNKRYAHHYVETRYLLVSYRAASDARRGITRLEEEISSENNFYLSEWKTRFVGITSLLRTAIDAFRVDIKSCINSEIRTELRKEWDSIKHNADQHKIFWQFLRRERDNILHEYHWSAYEAYLNQEGQIDPRALSLLALIEDGRTPVLLMKHGPYEGRNCLDLLKEASQWVDERIFSAIRRAGFDPNERRNVYDFSKPADTAPGILAGMLPVEAAAAPSHPYASDT